MSFNFFSRMSLPSSHPSDTESTDKDDRPLVVRRRHRPLRFTLVVRPDRQRSQVAVLQAPNRNACTTAQEATLREHVLRHFTLPAPAMHQMPPTFHDGANGRIRMPVERRLRRQKLFFVPGQGNIWKSTERTKVVANRTTTTTMAAARVQLHDIFGRAGRHNVRSHQQLLECFVLRLKRDGLQRNLLQLPVEKVRQRRTFSLPMEYQRWRKMVRTAI